MKRRPVDKAYMKKGIETILNMVSVFAVLKADVDGANDGKCLPLGAVNSKHNGGEDKVDGINDEGAFVWGICRVGDLAMDVNWSKCDGLNANSSFIHNSGHRIAEIFMLTILSQVQSAYSAYPWKMGTKQATFTSTRIIRDTLKA